MEHDTLLAYLDQWAEEKSNEIWLRDFRGVGSDDYSWRESRRQKVYVVDKNMCSTCATAPMKFFR